MNRFSAVFLAMLLLLSMQKKDGDTNVEKAGESSAQGAEAAASSDISSDESVESVKSNPSKKGEKGNVDAKKDDAKGKDEKNGAGPSKKDDKKDKSGDDKERAWKVEIEALKKKEDEMLEIMKKATKSANATDNGDGKEYRAIVREMGCHILATEAQIGKAREALKKFNEEVDEAAKKGGKAAAKSATPEEISEAKDDEAYLKKVEGTLKKWKVAFCDHFFSIIKKSTDSSGQPISFSISDEKSGSMMFYGGIAVVLCIAFFVLGYCFGGRKN